MHIENYIECQYREVQDCLNVEYIELYKSFDSEKLQKIFSTIHYICVENYKQMNQRLPTKDTPNHFWAEPSRKLIFAIEIVIDMKKKLERSEYAFNFDDYYEEIFNKSMQFLSKSEGSEIPPYMDKIDIYYKIPIILPANTVKIVSGNAEKICRLKLIGEGSYAQVFSFYDEYYNKKDLDEKEIERFKQEYNQMKALSSPYIVEVYRYENKSNEYIMEFMDCTLDKYIEQNNSKLIKSERKVIINQILRAFKYIHSKKLLHRDISPKNILIKKYEDVNVIKVSDFGLVKIENSNLTSVNTEFKGYFNDPGLEVEGFSNYGIVHETYALTRLVSFVMSGKKRVDNIQDDQLMEFVNKGLSKNLEERYRTVDEMIDHVKKL